MPNVKISHSASLLCHVHIARIHATTGKAVNDSLSQTFNNCPAGPTSTSLARGGRFGFLTVHRARSLDEKERRSAQPYTVA